MDSMRCGSLRLNATNCARNWERQARANPSLVRDDRRKAWKKGTASPCWLNKRSKQARRISDLPTRGGPSKSPIDTGHESDSSAPDCARAQTASISLRRPASPALEIWLRIFRGIRSVMFTIAVALHHEPNEKNGNQNSQLISL